MKKLMPRPAGWKLFIFPLLAALLLVGGFLWARSTLFLARSGERTDARIVAIVKAHEKSAELIVGAFYELSLRFADEQTLQVHFADGAPVRVVQGQQEYAGPQLAALRTTSSASASQRRLVELMAVAERIVAADVKSIERLIMQSQAGAKDRQIVSLDLTERAVLFEKLPLPLSGLESKLGTVNRALTAQGTMELAVPVERITTASFKKLDKQRDAQRIEQYKREVVISMHRSRNGQTQPLDVVRDGFIFHERDFRYIFRPVYLYSVKGQEYTLLGRYGRRHKLLGDMELGDVVQVAYHPDAPQRATLTASTAGLSKDEPLLNRFNALLETSLGRWYIPGLLLATAAVCLLVGLVMLSLYWWPPQDAGLSNDVVKE
jgi:hypothetical protein